MTYQDFINPNFLLPNQTSNKVAYFIEKHFSCSYQLEKLIVGVCYPRLEMHFLPIINFMWGYVAMSFLKGFHFLCMCSASSVTFLVIMIYCNICNSF